MARIAAGWVVLMGVLFATSAQAQTSPRSHGLLFHGHMNASGIHEREAPDADGGIGVGIGVGYNFPRRVGLFFHGDYAEIEDSPGTRRLEHFDMGVRFTFRGPEARWRPSLEASTGVRVSTRRGAEPSVSGPASEEEELSGSLFSIGGGVAYHFNPSLALDLRLRLGAGTFDRLSVNGQEIELEREERVRATSTRMNIGVAWYPFVRPPRPVAEEAPPPKAPVVAAELVAAPRGRRLSSVGDFVQVEIDGVRYRGLVERLPPDLLVIAEDGSILHVGEDTPVFMQETPCDVSAASEGGAWMGMFAGIIGTLLVSGGGAQAAVYVGSIFLGTTAATVVKVIDCGRWQQVDW
jgi:hypothetical protein